MLAFTLIITIWIGPQAYKFKAYSGGTYTYKETCDAAGEKLIAYILAKAHRIKGGRAQVEGFCERRQTHPA